MKPPKLFLTALAVFMLCTSLKCKKDKTGIDALPPITQEGKNTFGCLVNGEVLVPKGSGFNIVQEVTKNSDDYFIKIINNKRGSIILRLNAININTYSITCIDYINFLSQCNYILCPPEQFMLKLSKLDEANKIIAGEFSGTLPAIDNCGEVKITNGRFDLKYK